MKKLISFILCLVMCMAVLTSCGDENAPAVTTDGTDDTTAASDVINTTVPEGTATETTDAPITTESEAVIDTTAAETTENVTVADTTAPTENTDPADPDTAEIVAVLEAELAALKSGDIPENTYMADSAFANEDAATHAALYAKFEYTIGEVTIVDSDTATVKADIKMVNVATALTSYMTEIMAHSDEEDWDADFAVFYDLLSGEEAAVDKHNITINMTKTENGWTISKENNEGLDNAITGGLRTSDLLG